MELTGELKDVVRKAKVGICQDAGGVRLSYHQIGQIIDAEIEEERKRIVNLMERFPIGDGSCAIYGLTPVLFHALEK